MNISKKKKLCTALLLNELTEVEEEMDCLVEYYCKQRKCVSEVYSSRESKGMFQILIQKSLLDVEIKFKAYFKFTREQFYFMLNLIQADLTTQSCNRVKRPITPAEKLALTLRFLVTGESFRSLALSYRISPSHITTFIPKVLMALKDKLQPIHLSSPNQINWQVKAAEFWKRWHFPNVIGALHGKHVRITSPDGGGSLFCSYKKYFSVVLFAMVDANYKFLLVDVGSYGNEGDMGMFNKSEMGRLMQDGSMIFPPPRYLPNSNIFLPHVAVGNDAFRLDKHMMKAYSKRQSLEDAEKRNFNYHLSKVTRVAENTFDIMCSKFKIFFTPITVKSETVDLIIMVCCCLHNLLMDDYITKQPNFVEVQDIIQEIPVDNMIPLAGVGGFAGAEGFKVRNNFTEYFKGKSSNNKQCTNL